MTNGQQEQDENVNEIASVILRHGDAAHRGHSPEEVALEWLKAGFDDAEEIEEWLGARCFTQAGAQALERAGITPAQAALRTTAGASDYEDTLGYKTTSGDLSFDEARRIITNLFWNS